MLKTHKKCTDCHEVKPMSEFRKNYIGANGNIYYKSFCKSCESKRSSEYSKKHPEWRDRQNKKFLETPKGKEFIKRKTLRWSKENPEKVTAHRKVQNALRAHRLIRLCCQVCGDTNTHAHHEDYAKPLEVVWLCAKHHNIIHRTVQDNLC